MKRFVLFLVMAAAGAGRVPGEVLAQGNPPLTRSMAEQITDMFAWVLNGTFTPLERGEFCERLAALWQGADQSAVEGYLAMIDARPRLAEMSPEQREQARRQLEITIVNTLRQQSGDPMARLLLDVHDRGAGGSPAGATPAALIGTWGTGTVSGIGFKDTATGAVTNGGGTQVQYKFLPNGRYEYAALTTQTMYSCNTKLLTFKTGIVSYQGDLLTFVPQTAKFTSQDSCNARFNYEKPAGMERESYRWRIERDQYGVKMCLRNDKINGCAYKR